MVSGAEVFAPGVSESVTVTTTLKVPAAVGVPEINPLLLLGFVEIFKPGGNEELAAAQLQLKGVIPPVAVSVKVPGVPTVKVVLFALVIARPGLTVNVKFWIASAPAPLWAVKVMGYVPPLPAAGVPLSVPVEAVNVSPLGSVPVSLSDGVGTPVAVTVKAPVVPAVKDVLFALVIAGAWFTVNVKFWVVSAPTPLWPMNVM
jgi:hypothetical protein